MLWNFYKDGVTQSFINKYLLCRGQCYLSYCRGFTSIKLGDGLKFGLKGHKVLQEAYIRGRALEHNEIMPILMDEIVLPLCKTLEEELADQLMDAIVHELLSLYFKLHWSDFDHTHNWIHVEKRFRVPVDLDSNNWVYLNGQWDGVDFRSDDDIELMDHKHYKEINLADISEGLSFDPQVNIYLIAAHQLFGKFPKKIIYNILRRPSQKFTQKDNNKTFLEKVIKDIKERPSHYYMRIPYAPTPEELYHWHSTFLIPICRDIKEWYDKGCPYYFNPTALVTKYGRCEFFNYITNLPIENMHNIRIRNVVFTELDE